MPTKVERLRVDGYRKVKSSNNKNKNNYIDITQEWLDKAKTNNYKILDNNYFEYEGIKYEVDGKNVVLDYSEKEKAIADWLGSSFGGEVYMIPRVNNPSGIKTPDYIYKKENWDLKTINGKSKQALYHSVYNKDKQSNNFIFDISSSELSMNEGKNQIDKLYKRTDITFINKIIVKKGNDFFVFKRK